MPRTDPRGISTWSDEHMKSYEALQLLAAARREIDDKITVQQLQVFLAVVDAGADGADQSTLVLRTGTTAPQCSTVVNMMTKDGNYKTRGAGLGLLETQASYANRREKTVRLTTLGRAVAAKLLASKGAGA